MSRQVVESMSSDKLIGETVAHYRVLERLGAGGMGIVYRAEDIRLRRQIAIKFLPARVVGDELSRARFLREAQTASSLNHPNICAVYDIGEYEGQPFIVMELLTGKTLRQVIKGIAIEPTRLLEYAIQAADAIDTAHRAGIIHRDIKSSNIFVDEQGRVRLLDFGLAKLIEEPPAPTRIGESEDLTTDFVVELHTSTGSVVGTSQFMSPEQSRGERIDERSDIFSFGIILYEMATGKPPFRGKTVAVVFDQILNKVPEPFANDTSSVLARIQDVVLRCLEKRPEDRYQNAKDILSDLKMAELVEPSESKGAPGSDDTVSKQSLVTRSDGEAAQPIAISNLVDSGSRLSAAGQVPHGSIAVLPFINLSGSGDHDYFGDGLADELIGILMRVDGVHVASRTSAFQFKGQSLSVSEIGRRLNVATVLEGSFRLAGNRMRISANFINAEDGYQLWSNRFDRAMDDVFAIQDEIAQTIVHALEVTLGERSKAQLVQRATPSIDAYNHYLKGQYHLKRRTPNEIHKASQCFREALLLDAGFALAHAGLSDCYAMLGAYAIMPRRVVMPQAKAAATKAIELDESIAEAHAVLGLVGSIHDFEWESAAAEFRRAVEISPDYAIARYWSAIFNLLPVGRFSEAMGQTHWARELEPETATTHAAVGLVHYMQGEFEQAIEAVNRGLDREPSNPLCNITAGWAYVSSGRVEEAHDAFERCASMRVVALSGHTWTHAASGNRANVEAGLSQLVALSEQGNVQADFEIGKIFVTLGEFDDAMLRLEKTYQERAGTLFWINVNPAFDPIRNDRRFIELVKKMNLGAEP